MEVRVAKSMNAQALLEPPENAAVGENENAKPVATMATGMIPNTNGGKPVVLEMQPKDVADQKFAIPRNETGWWIKSNKMWMQPEDDNGLCQNCSAAHSQVRSCADGGSHPMLLHQMACEMATSAVEHTSPFRWVSQETQQTIATEVKSNAVLVNATRETRDCAPPIYKSRPATRAEMETRFCYNVNAKPMEDKEMHDACLYDSD